MKGRTMTPVCQKRPSRKPKSQPKSQSGGYLYLLASTEGGALSSLIRYFSGPNVKVSHIDAVMPTDKRFISAAWRDRRLRPGALVGARFSGGVQVREPGYGKFTYTRRMRVWVPDVSAAYRFLAAQIGKPYAKRAIVNFFLHRSRPFEMEQPEWFCDELFYAFALAGGTQLLHDANPSCLSPAELLLSDCLEDV